MRRLTTELTRPKGREMNDTKQDTAARPLGSGVEREVRARLVTLAAKMVRCEPLSSLSELEARAGKTMSRRALSVALDEAEEELKVIAIEMRRVADAL